MTGIGIKAHSQCGGGVGTSCGSPRLNFMGKLGNAHLCSLTGHIERAIPDHFRLRSLSAASR